MWAIRVKRGVHLELVLCSVRAFPKLVTGMPHRSHLRGSKGAPGEVEGWGGLALAFCGSTAWPRLRNSDVVNVVVDDDDDDDDDGNDDDDDDDESLAAMFAIGGRWRPGGGGAGLEVGSDGCYGKRGSMIGQLIDPTVMDVPAGDDQGFSKAGSKGGALTVIIPPMRGGGGGI